MHFNYKTNRTFFRPRRALSYVGGCIALLGIPIFFLAGGVFAAALPFVLVGLGCLVINRELNTKEGDIDEQIEHELERGADALLDRFYDPRHPDPRMRITTAGGFVTEGDGILIRRGQLHKTVSSEYHAAHFGFKGDMLHIAEVRFSLVEERSETKYHSFPLAALDRLEYRMREGELPHPELALFSGEGELVLAVPTHTNYTIEQMAEEMTAAFARARENTEGEA